MTPEWDSIRAAISGVAPEEIRYRRAVLTVACPWCRARPGEPCRLPTGEPLTKTVAHPSREELIA